MVNTGLDPTDDIPKYSTDIAAAWKVVEKLRDQYGSVQVTQQRMTYVEILCMWSANIFASADTTPHAICLAALKASGYEEKE